MQTDNTLKMTHILCHTQRSNCKPTFTECYEQANTMSTHSSSSKGQYFYLFWWLRL